MDVFDALPVAAVCLSYSPIDLAIVLQLVNDEVLCVHGGLSPELHTLDQIQLINRWEEIPNDGLFCDLMWSDPDNAMNYYEKSPRGAGYLFGGKATNEVFFCSAFSRYIFFSS